MENGVRQRVRDTAYRWALTTSAKAGEGQIEIAVRLANQYRVPFIPRNQQSLRELKESHQMDFLITVDRNSRVFMEEPAFHWHPAMAIPRFRRLMEGGEDVFLSAAEPVVGDRFLDCTLGLGADALIASWAVGGGGKVLGLEASPIVALITGWGLRHEAMNYDRRKAPVAVSAGRIDVLAEEAWPYLKELEDNCWDVVYFDPMFERPNVKSDGINSLRPLACYEPFTAEILAEAYRVCRKRVVLKERRFSPLFQTLGADRTVRTKYGPVAFGVWEK